MRQVPTFLAPRWLLGHAAVVVLAVTMILLGRWQLDVSNSKHFDLQNFGYALQWWAFTIFGVIFWARILRDYRRRPPDEPVAAVAPATVEAPRAYLSYRMPQSATAPAVAADSEHAAYNAYLARLASADAVPTVPTVPTVPPTRSDAAG